MAGPTTDFWQERFEKKQTGWDRGAASPQLLAWLDSEALKPCRIAVPGCGSGWEVAELARQGFDVVGIDYTPAAVERTRALLSAQGLMAEVLRADVLAYQPDKPFDAIYEQTCLCALHPDHWVEYARQLQKWLPGQYLGTVHADDSTGSDRRGAHSGAALSLRHQRHAGALSCARLGVAQAAL
ncbi:methyltransferase domain-containing protein [Polaromonas sp.]|uniref:methyltransferase domain-containing protein n=1 Tax=Polaromonas sp. TaxID=1869339 RepID=UPI0025E94C1A|nr:methyltransferase domain-containing protein [Polaromonas sp.]